MLFRMGDGRPLKIELATLFGRQKKAKLACNWKNWQARRKTPWAFFVAF